MLCFLCVSCAWVAIIWVGWTSHISSYILPYQTYLSLRDSRMITNATLSMCSCHVGSDYILLCARHTWPKVSLRRIGVTHASQWQCRLGVVVRAGDAPSRPTPLWWSLQGWMSDPSWRLRRYMLAQSCNSEPDLVWSLIAMQSWGETPLLCWTLFSLWLELKIFETWLLFFITQ